MSLATSWNFGADLCRALGLQPGAVESITLRCKANEIVQVRVVQFVSDDAAQRVLKVVSRYELSERPKEPVAEQPTLRSEG